MKGSSIKYVIATAAILCAALFPNNLHAQYGTFNFGGNSINDDFAIIAFRCASGDSRTYTVTAVREGFVFNDSKGEIHPASDPVFSGTVTPGNPLGFYRLADGSNPTPSGDIANAVANLGYGRYTFYVYTGYYTPSTFTVDFTDGNLMSGGAWPSNNGLSTSILIECSNEYPNPTKLKALCDSTMDAGNGVNEFPLQEIYDGSVDDAGTDVRYWQCVYVAYQKAWYLRDRDDFTLDGGDYPEGMNTAVLNVNATVTGDITIPTGKKLIIETDYDDYTESGGVTRLKFDTLRGLNIESGGSLICNNKVGGAVFTANTPIPSVGSWKGIYAYQPDSIRLEACEINHAGPGLDIRYPSDKVRLYLMTFWYCDRGLELVQQTGSTPYLNLIDAGWNRTHGIRVAGSEATPWFRNCFIYQNDGNGMVVDNGAYAFINNSAFRSNAGNGLVTKDQAHVKIDTCVFEANTGSGIRLCQSSSDADQDAWNTLQESNILLNGNAGIYLEAGANIRGWYYPSPINENDRWANVTDSLGRNCVRANYNANCIGEDDATVWELAREYQDPGGTSECHYLGGHNMIYDPAGYPNGVQLQIDNAALAWFQRNYWAGSGAFNVTASDPNPWDMQPELVSPPYPDLKCNAIGKFSQDDVRSAAQLLSMLAKKDEIAKSRMERIIEPVVTTATPFLIEAFPNPFNPSTEITYGIPVETHVKLSVFDNLGREVKTLVNDTKPAGTYTVTFDAGDLPSGMYLYRIETATGTVSKKMVLMK